MNILSVENASFAIGHVALLDKTSFQLDSGEKVGLIGRNGAGKSSFLKILAGVQKLDDGQIIVQNNLKIVYVPQESFFDKEATVFDTVAEGLGEIRDLLRRYHHVSHELENGSSEALLKELNELQLAIEAKDGWKLDAAVKQTLGELGLPENEKIGNLSGGQKKRVALAQAWVQKPDVLLLDEPTNHLDIDAIIWLENLLKAFEGSLVVITHDRRFLDNIATRIVELDRGILRSYPGSFSKYSEKKAQELAVEAEHNRLFDKFHAQEEAWIRKGIEARRTRNEGRVRRLEELRRQRAERLNVQGQVNFKLDSGDKIGLIGPNGIGKTTFLKLILGELQPTYGRIRIGSKQEVAYFDQFRSALNENDTVFYTLGQGNDYVEVGGKKKHVMSYLEDFLFPPARAQSPVSSLSGGERNRLLLAKLFTRPANILVLDEPTNDLDIDTQELLEDLLRDYQGTVFLVSHDRMFLDNVITQSIVFEGNGRLKEYIGGYQDYIDAKSREAKIQTESAPKTADAEPVKEKPKANRTVKLSYKEQRELDALPDEIAALEAEQAEINAQLSDPEIFKDYEKAGALQSRAEEIEMLLLEKLERWELLETKQNGNAV
ncbi:TPA: ATP-binding cassette domain-containing protein [Neisseria meningitidis]